MLSHATHSLADHIRLGVREQANGSLDRRTSSDRPRSLDGRQGYRSLIVAGRIEQPSHGVGEARVVVFGEMQAHRPHSGGAHQRVAISSEAFEIGEDLHPAAFAERSRDGHPDVRGLIGDGEVERLGGRFGLQSSDCRHGGPTNLGARVLQE